MIEDISTRRIPPIVRQLTMAAPPTFEQLHRAIGHPRHTPDGQIPQTHRSHTQPRHTFVQDYLVHSPLVQDRALKWSNAKFSKFLEISRFLGCFVPTCILNLSRFEPISWSQTESYCQIRVAFLSFHIYNMWFKEYIHIQTKIIYLYIIWICTYVQSSFDQQTYMHIIMIL